MGFLRGQQEQGDAENGHLNSKKKKAHSQFDCDA